MRGRDNSEARRQLHFAMSHSLRLAILKDLAEVTELSPRECAGRLGVPLANLGYHFRVLADCEAIVLLRTEPTGGAVKHYYRFAIKEQWALDALGVAALEQDDP